MDEKDMELDEGKERMLQEKSDALIGMLTDRGVLPDRGIDDEKLREARRERRKNAYHNTQLLLQHYRTIVWLMECFPGDVAQELDRPFEGIDALLEQMDLELSWGNRHLEERMAGIQKSRLLVDRVNEALTVLKKKPDNGEMLYKVIYMTYIAPERLKHQELLYRLGMSSRHYYRLRQQALTILSIRLWSAPDHEVDIWLEVLALVRGLE